MPPLHLSPSGQALIEAFENFASKAYVCPAGKLTIGFGHVIRPNEGHLRTARLTLDQARALLREDAKAIEIYLNGTLARAGLRQYHFDALVCFCFNVGIGAFDRSTLRERLHFGDKAGAAGEFAKWVYSKGVKLRGLVIRRRCERMMFDGMSDQAIEAERKRLQSMKGPL